MTTNFFQNIASITTNATEEWVIVVKKMSADNMVISVLYKDTSCGDPASRIIPPLIFNNTPQRIDECFFPDLNTAIPDTAVMLSSMEHFLKQKEQAKISSQMEKDKAAKAEKDKTDRQKKYEEAMKKVGELDTEGKHREAWMKVPDPAVYPEHAETIRGRKSELAKKFAPDLFNEPLKS